MSSAHRIPTAGLAERADQNHFAISVHHHAGRIAVVGLAGAKAAADIVARALRRLRRLWAGRRESRRRHRCPGLAASAAGEAEAVYRCGPPPPPARAPWSAPAGLPPCGLRAPGASW